METECIAGNSVITRKFVLVLEQGQDSSAVAPRCLVTGGWCSATNKVDHCEWDDVPLKWLHKLPLDFTQKLTFSKLSCASSEAGCFFSPFLLLENVPRGCMQAPGTRSCSWQGRGRVRPCFAPLSISWPSALLPHNGEIRNRQTETALLGVSEWDLRKSFGNSLSSLASNLSYRHFAAIKSDDGFVTVFLAEMIIAGFGQLLCDLN